MRKLIALWTAICLLFSLSAAAQEHPYPADTILAVTDLTEEQQSLADFLYGPVFRGETPIALLPSTRYDDVAPALNALTQNYPELFHLGTEYRISYYTDQPEIATQVALTYRVSPAEAADLRAQMYIRAGLMIAENPDPLALHDALCLTVTYGGDTGLRHTAAGALLDGVATCEGYAQALTLLYRMAGIPCGIIVGDATASDGQISRHAWNIADLDGHCLIDATWNDQDHLALNTHWYYGLSTAQMAADHTPDADQSVSLCDAQANWHDRHGYIVTAPEHADAAICRLIAGETVNLRIPDPTMYTALTEDLPAWLDRYNQRNPDAPFYGGYSITTSEAQMCLILQRVE